MSRKSEPLLVWLRQLLQTRKLNSAALAGTAGLDRARVRAILAGQEPMLVDELMQISEALKLGPAELGVAGVGDLAEPEAAPAAAPEVPVVDAWGNQPEQLLKIAFALGGDFFVAFDTAALEGSGVPERTLAAHKGRDLGIKLDAAYHRYTNPRYDATGITLDLSFDAIYTCRFPWKSVKQVVFFPAPPSPPEAVAEPEPEPPPEPKGRPKLRLV